MMTPLQKVNTASELMLIARRLLIEVIKQNQTLQSEPTFKDVIIELDAGSMRLGLLDDMLEALEGGGE